MQNTQMEHDQSTVASPTGQYYHEKVNPANDPNHPNNTAMGSSDNSWLRSKYLGNPFVTYGLRLGQWIFSIIALALAATSLSKFFRGEPRMRFLTFCGAFTLLYLICLSLVAIFKPLFLLPGAIFITEVVLCILWLAGFIAVAARYQGYSCKRQSFDSYISNYGPNYSGGYGSYIPYNAGSGRINGCKSGKASAAFGAISFLLFGLSAIVLSFTVIRKLLTRNRKPASLFQPGLQSNARLNRSGLAFSTLNVHDEEGQHTYGYHDDAATHNDQNTATGGYAISPVDDTTVGNEGITNPGQTTVTAGGNPYGNTQTAGTMQGNNTYGGTNYTTTTNQASNAAENVANAQYVGAEKPTNSNAV